MTFGRLDLEEGSLTGQFLKWHMETLGLLLFFLNLGYQEERWPTTHIHTSTMMDGADPGPTNPEQTSETLNRNIPTPLLGMATQDLLLARHSTTNASPIMFCFVSLVLVLLLLTFVCFLLKQDLTKFPGLASNSLRNLHRPFCWSQTLKWLGLQMVAPGLNFPFFVLWSFYHAFCHRDRK